MDKLQPLVFLGASPFLEVAEIVKDINAIKPRYKIVGILDDDPCTHNKLYDGTPVLGSIETYRKHPDVKFVMAIGSYKTRVARFDILKKLNLPSERYETLIHPSAKIYTNARIGTGCIINRGVIVFNDAVVENFAVILANSIIGIRTRICEGAMITTLVCVTADAVIGHYSHIGAFSAIGEKVKIGPCAQIGMGSVIFQDVPPGVFCMGNISKYVYLGKIKVPDALLDEWENSGYRAK